MIGTLSAGTGAGLVSALLIAVVARATPLAVLLFFLAPLPVLIVALGWNHRAGLVAAAVGSVAIAIVAGSAVAGLGFAVGTALPAWWLAYLALLGRPATADAAVEWYPLGRLLAWIAGTAALVVVASAVVSSGDYESFRRSLRPVAEGLLRTAVPAGGEQPDAQVVDAVIERFTTLAPAFAAQGFTLVLAFFVWAGAKVVALSGRLVRPWPFVPATRMPTVVLGLFAAAVALGFVGGFVGMFGVALCGALTMAFGLQGLAVLHDRSFGRPGRLAILVGLYTLLVLTQGVVLVFLALFGLADTAFDLRRKPARPGPGPRSV